MLTWFTKLDEGDWIIQNASNSSVGCNVIGLAKSMGIKTINIVRREEVVQDLKLLGGDHVLVDSPDIVQKITQLEGIGPIKLGIDAIAGKATNKLAAVLAPGSKIVSYGLLESQFIHLNTALVVMKKLSVHGFYTGHWFQETDSKTRMKVQKSWIDLIGKGELKIPIEQTYSLRAYKEALTHASKFGRKGKILFTGPGYRQEAATYS